VLRRRADGFAIRVAATWADPAGDAVNVAWVPRAAPTWRAWPARGGTRAPPFGDTRGVTPRLVLHVLPPSHPCAAVEAALRLKGLEYERVVLRAGEHTAEMERLYGEGRTTVPGLLVDDEPVHTSNAILERLEAMAPEPSLYPPALGERVAEAARWGDGELQDLGRRLPWGALHFRPEAMGTYGGAGPLDPAGTDVAIRYVRASWKYHRISAERLAADLAGLPEKLDRVDALVEEGVMGGEQPTAADLQIGATVRVLLTLGDLRPLIEGRPAERVARTWFPQRDGDVPAGAFPAGWVPA
jgi:glutathione S-transferase